MSLVKWAIFGLLLLPLMEIAVFVAVAVKLGFLAAVALTGGSFVGAGLEIWDAVAGTLLAEERGLTVHWWRLARDSSHHVLAGEPELVETFEPGMPNFIRAWHCQRADSPAGISADDLLGPSATILVGHEDE